MKPELLFVGLDVHAQSITTGLAPGDGSAVRLYGSLPNDLHALERVWTCAHCFHPRRSAEAEEWVKQRTLGILRGKVSQVVKGIRSRAWLLCDDSSMA